MSDLTESESSSFQTGGRVDGVPRRCWCGHKNELKRSKSKYNLNRRFFRCLFVAVNRLKDDKHAFKWMYEAILSVIENLGSKILSLDSKMMSLHQKLNTSRLKLEKRQREFESDILEMVESVLMDAKAWMEKLVVLLVVVVVVGCISLNILA